MLIAITIILITLRDEIEAQTNIPPMCARLISTSTAWNTEPTMCGTFFGKRVACYTLKSICTAFGMMKPTCSISELFRTQSVMPDVISQVPSEAVTVVFDNCASVDCGNILKPIQVQNKPYISWSADPNSLYTLLFVDPDAPSRIDHSLREWLHWLVINIPGSDVSKGVTVAEYVPSAPPKGTGLHRYIYLVYKQLDRYMALEYGYVSSTSKDKRPNFNTRSFANEHNLGQPIAGNLYLAEYDESMP